MASSPEPLPPPQEAPATAAATTTTTASPQQKQQDAPLPANPQRWSVADVCHWACNQPRIACIAPILREHAVDGHVLVNYVTNTVLTEELGVAAFGTRVHVLEAIEALRWNSGLCEKDKSSFPSSSSVSANNNSHQHHTPLSYQADDASMSTPPPPPRQPYQQHSHQRSKSSIRSVSNSPETDRHSPKEESPDLDVSVDATSQEKLAKRSASRVADAEKKRQKRAELKKNPVLYAEYLQKERERNARRRARLRAERDRSNSNPGTTPLDQNDSNSGANDAAPATIKDDSSQISMLNGTDMSSASPPGRIDTATAYTAYAAAPAASLAVSPTALSTGASSTVHLQHPLHPPAHNLRQGPEPVDAKNTQQHQQQQQQHQTNKTAHVV